MPAFQSKRPNARTRQGSRPAPGDPSWTSLPARAPTRQGQVLHMKHMKYRKHIETERDTLNHIEIKAMVFKISPQRNLSQSHSMSTSQVSLGRKEAKRSGQGAGEKGTRQSVKTIHWPNLGVEGESRFSLNVGSCLYLPGRLLQRQNVCNGRYFGKMERT